MSLRPIVGILVGLAILAVASVTTAGGALAHGQHPHPRAAASISFQAVADHAEEAAKDRVGVDEENLASPASDRDAPNDRSQRPCQGHCCGVAGLSCCGLAQQPARLASLPAHGAIKVIAISDLERDGLGPCSILRPPRTIG